MTIGSVPDTYTRAEFDPTDDPQQAADAITALLGERDALRAEVAALRQDAARYRWLRDIGDENWAALVTRASKGPTQIDAAIDAALAAKAGEP